MGLLSNWKPANPALKAPPSAPAVKAALAAAVVQNHQAGFVPTYAEIKRICNMPTSYPLDKAEADAVGHEVIKADAWRDGFRLFVPQAAGLLAYMNSHGGFFSIAVGWGKTLLALLIAYYAYTVKGFRKVVLIVPSNVYDQLWDHDLDWARKRVRLDGLVFLGLGNRSETQRLAFAKSGRSGCYILPYSVLSRPDATELLEAIAPELIISDEAHNLRHRTQSARAKRWVEYVTAHNPEIVVLSGTITGKSVLDYWHLVKPALKHGSPLPLAHQLAVEWAQVLDAGAAPSGAQAGPIMPLVQWAKRTYPRETFSEDVAGFRKAYKFRLQSTPGVVTSNDSEIGTALMIRNVPMPKHEKHPDWPALEKLTNKVLMEWTTPDGDEIEHAIHTFKWLNELSAGFYNSLYWPEHDALARRRGISEQDAIGLLERSKDWHRASQEYARVLRPWLQDHYMPNLDTPFLVGGDMARDGAKNVGEELYASWRKMRDLDFPGRLERDSEPVRVCGYKIEAAVAWASAIKKGSRGLIWHYHDAVGAWLVEALASAGLPVLHCPAGKQHNRTIVDAEATKGRIVVASIKAHGEGKNLQHFQEQLVVQWPRSAVAAEQLIGRTHRNGQEADELYVDTLRVLGFDDLLFAACLNDSLYIHQTGGGRQKLIYARYQPVPVIFPPEVLRQRGLEPHNLDAESRKELAEKFRRT